MRHKEYIETCEICHKTYIATRKGSTVCSNLCRAQKSRDRHKKLFKTQAEIIKTQAKVIDAILPKPDVELSTHHLSYSRDYDQIQKIIRELNSMRSEAEQIAISAGQGKERWSPYVKDSVRFQQLCKMLHNMLK